MPAPFGTLLTDEKNGKEFLQYLPPLMKNRSKAEPVDQVCVE